MNDKDEWRMHQGKPCKQRDSMIMITSIDDTLTGTPTPGLNYPWSNGNEGVFYTISRPTEQ